jgi:hypothetical protein
MTSTAETGVAGNGARFYDGRRRDLGWATRVERRRPSLGGLTALDITTSEPALASSLLMLDKARLTMTSVVPGESLVFVWASGYANGHEIRVQGVLAAK